MTEHKARIKAPQVVSFCLKVQTMSLVISVNGGKYTCQICGYQSLQKTHLEMHKQEVHDGKNFQCPECDYEVTQNGNLVNHHEPIHMGLKFQCLKCEHNFSSKGLNVQSVNTRPATKVPLLSIDNLYTWDEHFNV